MTADELRVDLATACKSEDWESAIAVCRRGLESGGELRAWTLQLAFVAFLWEENFDHDDLAIGAIHDLLTRYPEDAEVLFWASYILYMTTTTSEMTDNLLARALEIQPNHAYANLVKAGHLYATDQSAALRHLYATLETQPGNWRALSEVAELSLSLGRRSEALDAARSILDIPVHVETSLGCMNGYVNEVFIGIGRQDIRAFAADVVASDGDPKGARAWDYA